MDITVTPRRTKDDHRPYALVRFKAPGALPEYRTCALTPEAMDGWDEEVRAFILDRVPARMWQGVLWC